MKIKADYDDTLAQSAANRMYVEAFADIADPEVEWDGVAAYFSPEQLLAFLTKMYEIGRLN